jgi:tRNA A-37 threonylcarbamoyl transferase component Bud32
MKMSTKSSKTWANILAPNTAARTATGTGTGNRMNIDNLHQQHDDDDGDDDVFTMHMDNDKSTSMQASSPKSINSNSEHDAFGGQTDPIDLTINGTDTISHAVDATGTCTDTDTGVPANTTESDDRVNELPIKSLTDFQYEYVHDNNCADSDASSDKNNASTHAHAHAHLYGHVTSSMMGTTPVFVAQVPHEKAAVGMTIDDFVLLKVIGRGAYGKVFQCSRRSTGTIYAMKTLKKHELIDRKVSSNVLTEKAVLQAINHPFIVQLCYAFQSPSKLYLIMNYVGGGELFTRLDEVKELNDMDTAFYAAEVIAAIEHLHNMNILYRDLKPENVLLDVDGHIQLTDFGFAKHDVENERSSSFVGTIQYMAPEIVQKIGHGKAADYWAIGE